MSDIININEYESEDSCSSHPPTPTIEVKVCVVIHNRD
jgi:hypothetical protein